MLSHEAGILFGPESHHKSFKSPAEKNVRSGNQHGCLAPCGDFRARIRPQTPGSSCQGIQPSRSEGRAGSYRPPGFSKRKYPNTVFFYFHRPPPPNFNVEVEDATDQIKFIEVT